MSTPDVPAPAGAAPAPPAVTAPPAAPTPRRRPRLPPLLVVLGVLCLIVAVPVFRHGIGAHAFPSYEVRRYSAPWIAGGLALGGLGLVAVAVAVTLILAARRRPAPAPAVAVDPGLAPRPTEAAREF